MTNYANKYNDLKQIQDEEDNTDYIQQQSNTQRNMKLTLATNQEKQNYHHKNKHNDKTEKILIPRLKTKFENINNLLNNELESGITINQLSNTNTNYVNLDRKTPRLRHGGFLDNALKASNLNKLTQGKGHSHHFNIRSNLAKNLENSRIGKQSFSATKNLDKKIQTTIHWKDNFRVMTTPANQEDSSGPEIQTTRNSPKKRCNKLLQSKSHQNSPIKKPKIVNSGNYENCCEFITKNHETNKELMIVLDQFYQLKDDTSLQKKYFSLFPIDNLKTLAYLLTNEYKRWDNIFNHFKFYLSSLKKFYKENNIAEEDDSCTENLKWAGFDDIHQQKNTKKSDIISLLNNYTLTSRPSTHPNKPKKTRQSILLQNKFSQRNSLDSGIKVFTHKDFQNVIGKNYSQSLKDKGYGLTAERLKKECEDLDNKNTNASEYKVLFFYYLI